jgi:hypothetical protein
MKSIFSRAFKKKTDDFEIEIDEQVIKESKVQKKRVIKEYRDYKNKDFDWLINHLNKIDDVVNKNSFGSRNKSSFILDGHKFYKNDETRELFNKMYDNYTAYFYALKRYILVRKESTKYDDLGEDAYLAAGQIKELDREAGDIDKKLNLYLDNINKIKTIIRECVGL